MDCMFEQGPECQKCSVSEVLFLYSGPDIGSDIAGLPTIPGAMLLTILQNI